MSEISDKHKNLLLPYQVNDAENMIRIIKTNGAVLNSSMTGTGKTYTTVCACATLKLRPIVICPKSVIFIWGKVCEIFELKPFFIVNYETIRNSKYYDKNRKRIKCPYLKYDKKEKKYIWSNLPTDVLFVFDEVHRTNGFGSFNWELLLSTKASTNLPIALLSATVADTPEKFRLFFYILNFIKREQVIELKLDYKQYMNIIDKWIIRAPKPMVRIHNMLYPDRATRMNIDVLGDLFPENQVSATPFTMGKHTEIKIEAEYETIYEQLQLLKGKSAKDRGNILVKVLRAHQKIELLKIPTFVELAKDFMADGLSVVIFVNFTQTLKTLADLLNTKCLIYGEQTDDERQYNIESFQSDKQHIIICNIKAGSVGISLHDINGKRRRVSLISPTWSCIDLTQALGRIYRAGGKSKSLQRIIYCAGGIEEKIAEKLQRKLKDMSQINNGDLDVSGIIFEKKPQQLTE